MVERLTKEQYLETLEGVPVSSIRWEGCVTVHDGKITQYGEVIVPNPTVKQLSELMSELFENEFGTNDVMSVLAEEFGDDYPEAFE
jgi:hypothetical protein